MLKMDELKELRNRVSAYSVISGAHLKEQERVIREIDDMIAAREAQDKLEKLRESVKEWLKVPFVEEFPADKVVNAACELLKRINEEVEAREPRKKPNVEHEKGDEAFVPKFVRVGSVDFQYCGCIREGVGPGVDVEYSSDRGLYGCRVYCPVCDSSSLGYGKSKSEALCVAESLWRDSVEEAFLRRRDAFKRPNRLMDHLDEVTSGVLVDKVYSAEDRIRNLNKRVDSIQGRIANRLDRIEKNVEAARVEKRDFSEIEVKASQALAVAEQINRSVFENFENTDAIRQLEEDLARTRELLETHVKAREAFDRHTSERISLLEKQFEVKG